MAYRSCNRPGKRLRWGARKESFRADSLSCQCSGKHPICARCQVRGTECRYDVQEEGMTRREHLRHELNDQKHELDRKTAILRVMQTGSDHEATTMLARLRMGLSIDQAYEMLVEESEGREPYGTPDGDSIDAKTTSTVLDGAGESPSPMEDISSDVATGSSSQDGGQVVDGAPRETMQYGAADEPLETTDMPGPPWEHYHLYHPLSTVSLADINRSPEQANIDPALQTPRQDDAKDGPSSYSPRRGGF